MQRCLMQRRHAEGWSRREFLELTLAGTAGLLGLKPEPVAAEPPPETTLLRIGQIPSICLGAQYVAEEFLQGEGFTDVQYIKKEGTVGTEKALASGEADIHMHFAAPAIIRVDAGDPVVILAGGHVGCFALFGTERVHAIRH